MKAKRFSAVGTLLFTFLVLVMACPAEAADGLAEAAAMFSSENAESAECPLGRLAAEAVRQSCGADAAIVCGGDIKCDLPAGTVDEERIEKIFPEDKALVTAAVSPAQLKDVLESCFASLVIDLENGDCIDREASASQIYPQIAGFSVRCDATALPGNRVRKMEINGQTLDPEDDSTEILLCASAELLSEVLDNPDAENYTDTGYTLRSAFVQYIRNAEQLEKLPTAIYEVGSGDTTIADFILPGRSAGWLLLVFLLVFGVVRTKTKEPTEHDEF